MRKIRNILKIKRRGNQIKKRTNELSKPIMFDSYYESSIVNNIQNKRKNVWLWKPSNLNRGRGIELFENF